MMLKVNDERNRKTGKLADEMQRNVIMGNIEMNCVSCN